MAAQQRTFGEMKPEQRIADRFIQKHGLKPPIDIEAVLDNCADIQYDAPPANVDALLLRGSGRSRPVIILDPSRPETRRRFTLAHEFGHLSIPWHIGSFFCSTDCCSVPKTDIYRIMEAEANAFAAAFLMPTGWLEQLIQSDMPPKTMFAEAIVAQASASATAIRVFELLPAGHVYAIVDSSNRIQYAGKSAGTAMEWCGRKGSQLESTQYDRLASAHAHIELDYGSSMHWWVFGPSELVESDRDIRNGGRILTDITNQLCVDPDEAQRVFRSIQAIVGSAFGAYHHSSIWELLSVLKQRFAHRDRDLAPYIHHPDFDLYLSRRSLELENRR
jgi:Zn-dependent peptidase ImmA (M78 family)